MAYKRPRVVLITAVDLNGAIGVDGRLPWHCKADLRYFQTQTMGRVLVMGRKTADGLPKALRGRVNLVMTRDRNWSKPGFVPVYNKHQVNRAVRAMGQDAVWVIGGGAIYRQYIQQADVVHVSVLDCVVPDADTWFPMGDLAKFQGVYYHPSTDPKCTHYVYHRDAITSTRGCRARGVNLIC